MGDVHTMTQIRCGLTNCPANKNGKHSDPPSEITLAVEDGVIMLCDYYIKWLEENEAKEVESTESE